MPCTRPTTQCVQQLIVLVKNLPWALVPSHACLARHVQSVPPSLSCQRLRTLGPKTNTSRPNDNCRGRNKKKKKKNAIHKKAQTVRMQKKESGEISLHHRHPQRGFCEKKRPPHPPRFVGDQTHGAYRPASLRAGSGRVVLPDLSCVGGSVARDSFGSSTLRAEQFVPGKCKTPLSEAQGPPFLFRQCACLTVHPVCHTCALL